MEEPIRSPDGFPVATKGNWMRILLLALVCLVCCSSPVKAQGYTRAEVIAKIKEVKAKSAKPGEGSLYSPTTKRGEPIVAPGLFGGRSKDDQLYSKTHRGTPTSGMNDLRASQSRSSYGRPRYGSLPRTGLNPAMDAIDMAAYGPTLTFTTAANFGPGNSVSGPIRYQMYTVQNQNGGQTSIIYDRFSGTARGIEQLTSFGQVYYGPRTPGTEITPLPISFADGQGTGSFSGNVQGPSFGNVGPYGMPISVGVPSNATTPSFISPTYGVTTP